MATNRNYCLNLLKGIACLLVVCMHCRFPGITGTIIAAAGFWGVPFFFMISGFYAWHTDRDTIIAKTAKKIKKNIRITLCAMLVYIIWDWANGYFWKGDIGEVLAKYNLKNFLKVFITNDVDFQTGGQLWFMVALIYAYVLLWLLAKINKIQWVYPVAFLALVGRLYVTGLSNYHMALNFWFNGLPFFYLGFFLRTKADKIMQLKNSGMIVLALVGFIFAESGNFFSLKINIFDFGTVLFVIGLFLYAYNNANVGKGTLLEKIGTKCSLWIYITHVLAINIVSTISGQIFNQEPLWFQWSRPIIVIALSLLFSVFICWIDKKQRNKK